MSLKLMLVVVSVAVVAAVGLLVWEQRGTAPIRQHDMAALPQSSATTGPEPEKMPRRPLPRRDIADVSAVNAYKQSRLARVDEFNGWVRTAGVSSEQEAKILQILADAQGVYDETDEVQEQLRQDAYRMRDARMTAQQRQQVKESMGRHMDAFKRRDKDAIAETSAAHAKLVSTIYDRLEASAPADERAAFEAIGQVDDDLEAQVMVALADFLTPRQIALFERSMGSVSMLLLASRARLGYPAETLAARH